MQGIISAGHITQSCLNITKCNKTIQYTLTYSNLRHDFIISNLKLKASIKHEKYILKRISKSQKHDEYIANATTRGKLTNKFLRKIKSTKITQPFLSQSKQNIPT